MSLLDDIVSGDGLSSLHGIIWLGLGVWALIGTLFYIPAKRKQDKINELSKPPDNKIPTGLSEINLLSTDFLKSLYKS